MAGEFMDEIHIWQPPTSSTMDSDPGSELFSSYESDFKLVQADFSQKLEQIPELRGEERKAAVGAAKRAIDEGEEIVSCSLLREYS